MNRRGRRAGRHRKSVLCLEVLERRELLAADLVAHWLAHDLLSQQSAGTPVVRWVDRVHGVATVTEGRPLLATAAVGDRAAVRFELSDGPDLLRVVEQNNPLRGQTDFSVVVVFATNSPDLRGDQGPWFENTGLVDASELGFTRDWGLSLNHAGQLSAGLGFGLQKPPVSLYLTSTGLNDGQSHTAVFSRAGRQLSLRVDDLPAVVSPAGHNEPLADVDLVFGALQYRQGFFTGDIAEVRMYRGALSAAEQERLQSELQAFYHNSPPTAVDDQYTLLEDPVIFAIPAGAGVLHNDRDLDSDALTAVLGEPPQHGKVRLSADGSFIYDPDLDFFGTDRFTYAAVDYRPSPLATVQLIVTPTYDPVIARADTYAALPREVLRLDASQGVLGNDENPDHAPLQVILDQDVGRGQLRLQSDGSLTYDAQGFVGTTHFTYRVQDGTRLSPPTLVTLSVNTPPVAVPDRFVGREDQRLIVSAKSGVLANDIDPDDQPRSVQLGEATRHGSLMLAGDGSFEYQPGTDFVGVDSFTYWWTDGMQRSAEVQVGLEFEAVNDPPVASVDHYFALPDLALNIPVTSGVLVNDVDVDGPELKSVLIDPPVHGLLQLNSDGGFSYRPTQGFRGMDFFTYRASDSQDVSQITRVNLTISKTPLRISEFMATNASLWPTRTRQTPTDRFAGPTLTPDWIELENLTEQPLDLGGMSLTDDPQSLQKWPFPQGVMLAPRSYLLVFASSRNVTDPALDERGWLHTNFSLSGDGDYLALTARDGTVLHEYAPGYPPQVVDVSYGLMEGRGAQYFHPATPGQPNRPGLAGLVADPRFSHPHGFYEESIEVEVASDTPGATLVYTTDGSEPTLTNGVQILADPSRGPTVRLEIGQTTTLRAAAFKEGWVATDASTQSYFFLADILQRARFSSTVKDHPVWGPQLKDSLLALPSVSLVIPGQISETEREASLELIFPDGTRGFQIDAGIEYFGGHSLGSPKKNMRLSFKSRYGDSQLTYDLFGAGATDAFEQLLLRTGSHDTFFWTHPDGGKGNYIRNRWAFDRQLEMGQPAPHGRFVHVYLNGQYWGQHELMERPNAAFMASYFGGWPEDYDALNAGTAVDGDAAAWQQLQRSEVIKDYDRLRQYLDVVNYADYMLLQFFGGNDWDWNHTQNWMAARRREPGAGFAFFSWDSDVILRTSATANVISRGGPGNLWNLHGGVKQHAEFKMLLADRAQRYFFHDGMFTDERLRQDIDDLASQIRLPMIAETARWGSRSYTPDVWESAITWMRDRFAPAGRNGRAATVIRQLRQAGLFPDFDAPNH